MTINTTSTTTVINYDARLDAAFNGIKDGTILNGHYDDNRPIKISGIAVLKNGKPVALFKGSNFCLNLVETKKGVSRLSPWSVAGNIYARDMSLEDAIESYNDGIIKAVADGAMRDDGQMIAIYKLIDEEV